MGENKYESMSVAIDTAPLLVISKRRNVRMLADDGVRRDEDQAKRHDVRMMADDHAGWSDIRMKIGKDGATLGCCLVFRPNKIL